MKIVLTRRYSTYQPGDSVDCDDDIAERLVRDGVAEPVEKPQQIETAAIDVQAETADVTPRRIDRQGKVK